MKPLDHTLFDNTRGPSHRTRALIAERDFWLREAARLHLPADDSDRERARLLHKAFTRYRNDGAWARQRSAAECPHSSCIEACLWRALKARDISLKLASVRRAMACYF